MSQPYAEFLAEFSDLLDRAVRLPRGGLKPAPRPAPRADAPLALVLAPHPDDECIVGVLPLRLQRELGWRVAVVPVTLGSRVERREARLAELRGACGFLGWEVLPLAGDDVTALLRREKPHLVVFPHAADANSTHRAVHLRVVAALAELGREAAPAAAETEFWATLPDPNLMLEASPADAGDLVAALSFHEGEIARNPYHVLLPCWLADGMRRGAELVGGQGASAPSFRLAALYRLSRWNGRGLERLPGPGRVAAAGTGLAAALAPLAG